MKRTGRKKEWAILVFCLFFLGISPPLIRVFDTPYMIFELPMSFLYLYGLWALMILFIAIGARRREPLVEANMGMPALSDETLASANAEKNNAQ